MKNVSIADIDHDLFTAKRVEDIIVLNLTEDLLLHAVDLSEKNRLFDYLEVISESDEIKALLIMGSPGKTGREEYIKFYGQVLANELDRNAINRLYNAANQIILKFVSFNKMVVHADAGKVISLFMNVSLACDYRIIGDNTVFQKPYFELELIPKGGGVFFLSKMLGLRKASEILFSNKDITAEEALRLGIVDQVVPADKLGEAALNKARDFARRAGPSLSGIKGLFSCYMKDLADSLECENKELLKIVSSPDFGKKMGEYTGDNS